MSNKVNIEVQNNKVKDLNVEFFPSLSETVSNQTYVFTFAPNSAKYNAQTVAADGKIGEIDAPSGTKVFKSISTSPFQQQVGTGDSVSEGDILQVELDAAPTSKETVELVVSYADISETKTLPEDLGGNGDFMYVTCTPARVIEAVDLVNEFTTTISLPTNFSGGQGSSIHYNHFDKNIYFFYEDSNSNLQLAIINADSNSAKFNTITQTFSINYPAAGNIADRTYFDATQDRFICFKNPSFLINKNGTIGKRVGVLSQHQTPNEGSYLLNLIMPRNIRGSGSLDFYRFDTNLNYTVFQTDYQDRESGDVLYNPVNQLLYASDGNGINVFETDTFTRIAVISGIDRGFLTMDYSRNLIIASDFAGSINKIDGSTNSLIGQESINGLPAGIHHSPATGFFYCAVADTDEVLVIDGTQSVGNMVLRSIPIPNYDQVRNKTTAINLLKL